jgi:hypothetical protein
MFSRGDAAAPAVPPWTSAPGQCDTPEWRPLEQTAQAAYIPELDASPRWPVTGPVTGIAAGSTAGTVSVAESRSAEAPSAESGPTRLEAQTAETLALVTRVRSALAPGELRVWGDTGLPSIPSVQRHLRCEKRKAQSVWDALVILADTDPIGTTVPPPNTAPVPAAESAAAPPTLLAAHVERPAMSSEAALVLRRPLVWPNPESPPIPSPPPSHMPVPRTEPDQLWLPADLTRPRAPRKSKPRRWRRRPQSAERRTPARVVSVERPLGSWEPVSVTEACGYATRFAADYLSWDELEPARRPAALHQYLADPSMADVGWNGRGRQRADWATAGRTVVLASGAVVIVEVTARVVRYHRTSLTCEDMWSPPNGEATPSLAFAPASAPPTTVPGWEPGAAWWVRIAPPVRRDHDGRLVIDLGLDLSAAES